LGFYGYAFVVFGNNFPSRKAAALSSAARATPKASTSTPKSHITSLALRPGKSSSHGSEELHFVCLGHTRQSFWGLAVFHTAKKPSRTHNYTHTHCNPHSFVYLHRIINVKLL
jgi:hypothetical protein